MAMWHQTAEDYASTEFDYILPYARQVIEFNIPQRTVSIDAILQYIIVGLNLNGSYHKLPLLWTWLISGRVSPLKRLPREGPVDTLIFNDTLQRLCEARGFSIGGSVKVPLEHFGGENSPANKQVSQTKDIQSSETGSPLPFPLSSPERPLYGGNKVPGQHKWRAGRSPRYYEPSRSKSHITKATRTGNSTDFMISEDQTATTHSEAAHPRPKRSDSFIANAATRESPSNLKAWEDSERPKWSVYERPDLGTSTSAILAGNANAKVGNPLAQPRDADVVHQRNPSHSGSNKLLGKEYGVKEFKPRFTGRGMVTPKVEHGFGFLVSSEAASHERPRPQVSAQGGREYSRHPPLTSEHEDGSNISSSCPSSPTCQASVHSWEPYIGTAPGPTALRQDKENLDYSRQKPLPSQLAGSNSATRLAIPSLLNPAFPVTPPPVAAFASIDTSFHQDIAPEGDLPVDTCASKNALSHRDSASEDSGLRAMTDKKKPRKVAAGAIPPTLPPSVEEAYRKKCIELKRRMAEVENSNDSFRLRKTRLLRGIRKMRLERTILLDLLGKRMRKNGANGYYDTDSEGSSDGPPTVRCTPSDIVDDEATNFLNAVQPHDKPLRSKRSHRRAMQSPPPTFTNQLSGPNPALSQQPLPAFQTPYAPHHEGPFTHAHTPNGVSHIQPHLAQRVSFSINNLHPSPQSQIAFPASAYDFFVEENFLRLPQNQLKSRDELLADALAAWQGQSHPQAQEWLAYYNERLQKWRTDMDYLARQTGERPQGVLRGGGLEEEMAEQEAAARDEEMERLREDEIERLRDEEMAERVGGGRRVGSGGFTSING